MKDNLKLPSNKDLPDGSYLAEVFHPTKDRKRRHPVVVRVIEYTIEDGREPVGPIRLITAILDPDQAGAEREGWPGEAEGLQISLAGAQDKLDQIARRSHPVTVRLSPRQQRSGHVATNAVPSLR